MGPGPGGSLRIVLDVVVGIAIVVALVSLVGSALPGRGRSPIDDAAQILDARLARCEITEAEYEQAQCLPGIS